MPETLSSPREERGPIPLAGPEEGDRPGSDQAPWWARLSDGVGGYLSGLTPVRLASHVAVILVAMLVLIFSRMEMPRWELALPQPPPSPAAAEEPVPWVSFWPNRGGSYLGSGDALRREAVPFTTIPDRPREGIITYTVQAGDTLYGIASQFDLSVDTLKWANGLELCPNLLRVGQQLTILPVDGVSHTVKEGDTIADIARRYEVEPEAIVNYKPNGLEDEDSPLTVGQVLIIPGGRKEGLPSVFSGFAGEPGKPSKMGTGHFIWPIRGRIKILDWYGTKTIGGKPGGKPRKWPHKGIDIQAFLGTPVLAADSGLVTIARTGDYNGGYGNYIVIDHGNGFSTLYAHLSGVSVQRGDVVAQGQRIGAAGATGMVTGPHLHFEIRYNGKHRDPLCFLVVP